LLEAEVAPVWFHGHGTPVTDPVAVGPGKNCLVVPMGDVAFPGRGRAPQDPGLHGWAYAKFRDGEPTVVKETPPFWREFRRHLWATSKDGPLVCPPLARFLFGFER